MATPLRCSRSPGQLTQTGLLYGSSVEPENTPRLLEAPEMNGLLVGAASLDPHAFAAIIAAACR